MSVTDIDCQCETVQDSIARKSECFGYDGEMNEYRLLLPSGIPGLILYHCPFCGGVLTKSTRGEKFYTVANDEEERIRRACEGITTIKMAISVFGNPEYDNPQGSGHSMIDKITGESTTRYFRSILYKNISKTADVRFTETENGTVFLGISGKFIE